MQKIILITGGSSGIGAECARHAVKAGHNVALLGRSEAKLNTLVAEFGPDNAIGLQCDVTKPEDQESAFEQTARHFGRIDVVFANAGLGASSKGTEHGDIESFREMVMVNNFALAVTAKFAIPHIRKSSGHLVLTGSLAGHSTVWGSVYSATKWFVRGYADNLAAELSDCGARVTNINPGMVDTPFFDEPKPDALRPEDIANAFLYAIEQPPHVLVPSIQIYPRPQKPYYDPNH